MLPLLIAADHAGWKRKETLKKKLIRMDVSVRDLTPTFKAGDDYPAIAKKLAQTVAKVPNARGVLLCGSGVGMAIAANRIKGARAVEGYSVQQVKLARRDNNANVLSLGTWDLPQHLVMPLIKIFLATKTSTAKRHLRRIKQLG